MLFYWWMKEEQYIEDTTSFFFAWTKIESFSTGTALPRGRLGRDCIAVWFITTCVISAYHHHSCEFECRSWRGVLDTTIRDKVCQWLVTGRWFSPVSSTNKTDRHDITEILLKVALNIINIFVNYVNRNISCDCQTDLVSFSVSSSGLISLIFRGFCPVILHNIFMNVQ